VRVRENDRVQPIDLLPQNLEAKLRRGVHNELGRFGRNINGGSHPVVFRILEESWGVFFSNNRHPLGGAGAKKGKRKRHSGNEKLSDYFPWDSVCRDWRCPMGTLRWA